LQTTVHAEERKTSNKKNGRDRTAVKADKFHLAMVIGTGIGSEGTNETNKVIIPRVIPR
jgi:hypothetical protein